MNVRPIGTPLPGEHLTATSPRMRPETDETAGTNDARWRVRLNFWAGRALTAEALELEQENRAARLAWSGRLATPGIVSGLEVALEAPASPDGAATPAGHFVHILPGHGLLADGEDVVVPRPLRVPLGSIPLHYVRMAAADGEGATEPAPPGATPGEPHDAGGLFFTVDTFGADHQPWAAALILCPAELRTFERVVPEDPCELDPSRDGFADERRLDAFVVRLVQLPVRLESLPELADRDDPRWRNLLAHAVLSDEARRSARQQTRFLEGRPEGHHWDMVMRETGLAPWQLLGVPLGLLSLELAPGTTAHRYFIDRAVVSRPGGLARPRTRPAVRIATGTTDETLNPPGSGTPFTWRASIEQFAEHLGLLAASTEAEVMAAAARFRFVPPAGFLPRAAVSLLTTEQAMLLPPRPDQRPDRAGVNHFFPAAFSVEAVPVATEALDAALASSASLAPYDFVGSEPQPVRMLVPVPQRVFDPDLLVVEQEDPVFAQTVARFAGARQDWRQRRDIVAGRRDALKTLMDGPAPPAPLVALEPGQLEPEPVETAAGLGFTEALLSPVETAPPWEMAVAFAAEHTITANATLFLKLRVDQDAPPPRIEVRWRRGSDQLTFAWLESPVPPAQRLDGDGRPLATPLWLHFVVTAKELGVAGGAIGGFTLGLEGGRVGVAAAGQLVAGQQPGTPVEEIWWRAQDSDVTPAFTGGEWTRISGDLLLAPFEDLYTPVFPDGRSLQARLAEVEAAINPPGVTPRTVPMTIATHGLARMVGELELEAAEADDFIDTNFTRAQVNLYRIRKLILGQQAAQKLLINPAIATIAEQETATASADQLGSFITAAKGRTVRFGEVNTILSGSVAPRAVTRGPATRAGINPATVSKAGNLNPFAVATPFKLPSTAILVDRVDRVGTFPAATDPPARIEDKLEAKLQFKSDALKDVIGDRPETGPTLPPRGLSIGQRFTEPKATQNLSYSRSALTLFLSELPRLRLPLAGETVRSLAGQDVSLTELQGRAIATAPATPESLRTAAIARLLTAPALTQDTDEAEVTLAALDLTEIKSAILRTIERVSQTHRAIAVTGAETLAALAERRAAAAARVGAIEGKLAEARQDVSVARALRQEEQQRLADVNARRDALIRDEVKFLVYVRPRSVELVRRNLSYWMLDTPDAVATLPACLQRHDEPPPPLNAYLQLFRHAPARWFPALAPLLERLDTPDKMVALLDSALLSASSFARFDAAPALRGSADAVQFTVLGARQTIGTLRQRAAILPVADQRTVRWQDLQRDAAEHASVGDLIDGKHGATKVSAAAAGELERIGDVATCLHAELAAVTPAIRLAWIERFSQFDRPAPLRNLTILPQYARLDRSTRRRLQELTDWLFGRVTTQEPDAVALINDLIRLCLLLASHAPVNRIIAGHVPRPTPVRPGLHIPIRPLNPELVRVGMDFQVWRASTIVARGTVADLREGEVSARVDAVDARTTTIDSSMRVQFMAQAAAFKR